MITIFHPVMTLIPQRAWVPLTMPDRRGRFDEGHHLQGITARDASAKLLWLAAKDCHGGTAQ